MLHGGGRGVLLRWEGCVAEVSGGGWKRVLLRGGWRAGEEGFINCIFPTH